MTKTYIGLCLTLLICNSAFSVDPQAELIKILLQSEEAQFARKKELIADGEEQNKIRKIVLGAGTLITAVSSLVPKYSITELWDSQESELVRSLDPHWKIILTHALGFAIMGIGAYLPYTDTKNMQIDIDHAEEKIKQFKTELAQLQTKTPSSPETNATSEELGS